VKVNFTDVRISAMEDFVGRGDRTLASVLRRAWELGAGMDSWFDNLDKAFVAWESAIAEAGLDWKYRQVLSGEWNVMQGSSADERLDSPLPWDHIDTGIDKKWLKEDLQRAMEAATVPDCSFDGCSHCGVCGTDFGHNIVVPPPPIPEFAGDFVPDTTKAKRLRVRFGKQDDMALVGHLDLMRVFDRAVRRAGLPVSFSGGFNPQPRISVANALPLGATSSSEIVDFELTQQFDIDTFVHHLSSALPNGIPIYDVVELDLKSKSASQLLETAEYLITVRVDREATLSEWQNWIDAIIAKEEIWTQHKTKKGKIKNVNLRERLFELELVETVKIETSYNNAVKLRYLGACRNDGTLLRPEQIPFMLESVTTTEFNLLHIHRSKLILAF
jgi:radical SAM-linked protein